jgi:hypothetical protein
MQSGKRFPFGFALRKGQANFWEKEFFKGQFFPKAIAKTPQNWQNLKKPKL